jgi:4a-hydroxytetrahydrobiopterin dehydratase
MTSSNLENFTFDNLVNLDLTPVPDGTTSMTDEQISEALKYVFLDKPAKAKRWEFRNANGAKVLFGRFFLRSYQEAFAFVSAIYLLGNEVGYYPDITFGESFVFVSLFTIKISGLHENDFIMMAKIENMMNDNVSNDKQDGNSI